ncbi:MAG: ribosome-recycling factor, partial [bacterium]
ANLGLNPNRDGDSIKIHLPPMTHETRQNMLKLAKKEIEDGKVSVRNVRHEAKKKIEAAQKNKEISEDDMRRQEAQMEKDTHKYIEEMDALYVKKEKEIIEG